MWDIQAVTSPFLKCSATFLLEIILKKKRSNTAGKLQQKFSHSIQSAFGLQSFKRTMKLLSFGKNLFRKSVLSEWVKKITFGQWETQDLAVLVLSSYLTEGPNTAT